MTQKEPLSSSMRSTIRLQRWGLTICETVVPEGLISSTLLKTMNNRVTTPICLKQINSYQKLRFLLFLHQSPEFEGTSHAFAERLHLGDTQLVEQIITELQDRGLIKRLGNCYRMRSQTNRNLWEESDSKGDMIEFSLKEFMKKEGKRREALLST